MPGAGSTVIVGRAEDTRSRNRVNLGTLFLFFSWTGLYVWDFSHFSFVLDSGLGVNSKVHAGRPLRVRGILQRRYITNGIHITIMTMIIIRDRGAVFLSQIGPPTPEARRNSGESLCSNKRPPQDILYIK